MKEYSKGIYVKFKPEEVDKLHNRMQEAGVQNMSAYRPFLHSREVFKLRKPLGFFYFWR